ncbi:CUB and peptidase domain-containing protein 1 [Folsomia candida]|uniref:limulus clotting factor C n=1 Tax=Folsomia candida TaxID=158441 RepID=A0A226D6Z6_FOLCA|nr:CUB and peptidase domain-containing protein 1 [Folsomia candida]OXA40890.1 Trypsin-1 [Folsomia candida]
MKSSTPLISFIYTLVVVTYGAPPPSDFRGLNTGKIVGGVEADRHEFKFLVDIRLQNIHLCGGSIVTPEWVVTAAHCAHSAPSGYTLSAGEHNINVTEGTEQVRQVTQINIHPNYLSYQYENDIALMRVSPPFEFNEYVQPVVIPNVNFAPTTLATVTGWGSISEGGGSPPNDNLMKVVVPFVDDVTCQRNHYGEIAPSMVCYGEAGKDSCHGDSGSPLLCGDNQTLCGIVSWGEGCARPNLFRVYTETSFFSEWIRSSTIKFEEDSNPAQFITTCGARIDASSAEITFQLGASIPAGQKCVWVVKTRYDSVRFRLSSSGLGENDGLYLTNFAHSEPGTQKRMTSVGQNYTVASGFVLVTLSIGSAPSSGFRLEFFSSGFSDQTRDFSEFARFTTNTGRLSYPIDGGITRPNEDALFVINPTMSAVRTLRLTRMDVETDTDPSCRYDAVTIYDWFDNQYRHLDRRCGYSLPPSFTLESGLGLVTFQSDSGVGGTGFDFEWV